MGGPKPAPAVVAFLGPEASYTHQAAQKAYPDRKTTYLDPQPTIPSLFQCIQDQGYDAPDLAICPIENSTNGPVAATLDLLADPRGAWPDVCVVGEIRVPVRHCLLIPSYAATSVSPSRAGSVSSPPLNSDGVPSLTTGASDDETPVPLPTIDFHNGPEAVPEEVIQCLKKVDTLYTHPQAWGQCTRFLGWLDEVRHEEGNSSVQRIDTTSTSHAAGVVAGDGKSATPDAEVPDPAEKMGGVTYGGAEAHDEAHVDAAISSAATLALHPDSLAVLLTGLEDSTENVTRFVVLANRHKELPALPQPSRPEDVRDVKQKALLTLSLMGPSGGADEGKRSKPLPGALAKSLAVFEHWGINLTSIAARPSGRAPWDYVFVVEVEIDEQARSQSQGKWEQADGLALVERALQDVRAVAGEARCCGVWSFDDSEPL